MTTSETRKAANTSLMRDLGHAARYYLGNRRALLILAVVAVIGGTALNWSWLVAAGIAPVLLTALPCLVMCGLGLCMTKMVGGSCASQPLQLDKTELTTQSPMSGHVSPTTGDLSARVSSCCPGSADAKVSADQRKT